MGGEKPRQGFRLPRKRILRGRGAFEAVFERGKIVRGRFVDAFYLPGQAELRVGFAVSRRVRGKVKRNRAKRRVREAFRLRQYGFPKLGDAVLLARERALTAEWSDLLQDVEEIGKRLGNLAGVAGQDDG
ncbi:MAG: ribonuclease P protein component [Calditrichaeota bacterium]|nr:ribonuclease P protein component [Calditrichota bacterium]